MGAKNKKRASICLAIGAYFVALLISSAALSSDLQKAFKDLSNGRFDEALPVLTQPEHSQKILVQYKLAETYLNRAAGAADLRKSARLFRLAFENQNSLTAEEFGAGLEYLAPGDIGVVLTFLKQVAAMRHGDILVKLSEITDSEPEICLWRGLAEKYASLPVSRDRKRSDCVAKIVRCDRSYYVDC